MKLAVYCYDTENIGDDIQTLAVVSCLKRPVDYYVMRDDISKVFDANLKPLAGPLNEHVILIANGWYSHSARRNTWTPAEEQRAPLDAYTFPPQTGYIHPLILSFHVRRTHIGILTDAERFGAFWRSQGPLLCRDAFTAASLARAGFEANFWGCMTLLIDREAVLGPFNGPTIDKDLLVDCTKDQVAAAGYEVIAYDRDTQIVPFKMGLQERQALAKSKLQKYSRYARIFTTRLHVWLPCSSMGLPVFLVGPLDERTKDFADLSWVNRDAMRATFFERLQALETALEAAVDTKARLL